MSNLIYPKRGLWLPKPLWGRYRNAAGTARLRNDAGTARFNDDHCCCEGEPCGRALCDNGSTPSTVTLTFSGVEDGTLGLGCGCTDYNLAFVCTLTTINSTSTQYTWTSCENVDPTIVTAKDNTGNCSTTFDIVCTDADTDCPSNETTDAYATANLSWSDSDRSNASDAGSIFLGAAIFASLQDESAGQSCAFGTDILNEGFEIELDANSYAVWDATEEYWFLDPCELDEDLDAYTDGSTIRNSCSFENGSCNFVL